MSHFEWQAQMAELVDALDSKSCYRKVVQVRFLFWALSKTLTIKLLQRFAFLYISISSAFLRFFPLTYKVSLNQPLIG